MRIIKLILVFCAGALVCYGAKADLTIINEGGHDTPVPAVGVYSINVGDPVTAYMTNTVVNEAGTTWTCVGYYGSGNVAAVGTETSLQFNIIVDTTIHWQWTSQFEVEDFEGYTSGSQVMFRQPSYSGGTTGIEPGDFAKISYEDSNNTLDLNAGALIKTSEACDTVYWEWTSSGSGTVRLTTNFTDNRPNPLIDFNKGLSIYYKLNTGDLDVELWLRETGGDGPIGGDGGVVGTIERTATAKRIVEGAGWQYLYFDIPNETWDGVTGDDNLDGDWGVIESLYFKAVAGDPSKEIILCIDDIYQGPEQTPYFPTPTPTPIYIVDNIQEGIDACEVEGTEIIVPVGVFKENLRISGKDVILRSLDPTSPTIVARTIIDGGNLASCIWLEGTETNLLKIDGFTIINGNGLNSVGGGIEGNGTKATIRNCIFYYCESDGIMGAGGAINDCDGIINDCKFISNISTNMGGALANCDGIISDNIINSNMADFGGGLAYCNGIIQYNLIIGNNSQTDSNYRGYGGGLYACDGDVNHNTIVFNRANFGGGIAKCVGFIRNNIIWYNTAMRDQSVCPDSEPEYSCVMNFTGGENNIQDEPKFIDWPIGDFELAADSPCLNAAGDGGNMGYK